jgi:hypothetical protein
MAGASKTQLIDTLAFQLRVAGVPLPECEHRFYDKRAWRFDFAWPTIKLAVEVEGGVWAPTPGRHTRGSGFVKDCAKYNTAAILGWAVIRGEASMVRDGTLLKMLQWAMSIKLQHRMEERRGHQGHD